MPALVGDDVVGVVLGDRSYSGNRAVVYHLSDDKIAGLWAMDWDQAAFDAFMP